MDASTLLDKLKFRRDQLHSCLMAVWVEKTHLSSWLEEHQVITACIDYIENHENAEAYTYQ